VRNIWAKSVTYKVGQFGLIVKATRNISEREGKVYTRIKYLIFRRKYVADLVKNTQT